MSPTLDGPRLPPRSGGAPRQLVVLLHGYGADGADLLPLAEAWAPLLPDAAFVAPNAPEPCAEAPVGRQWFPLSLRAPDEIRRGVTSAAPTLHAFLDEELAARDLADGALALVGFSQGTMLALYSGPQRARKIAGILGYSGLIAWPVPSGAAEKPPVLLFHGAADELIPAAALSAARQALNAAGFPVEAHLRPWLGHGIDSAGIEAGGRFLERVLPR